MTDLELIERFSEDPASAYRDLLDKYTPMLLRMIRRFIKDPDEVMEVYARICERLHDHDYQALRRFRLDSELTPWLSVVVANACRDRFRKVRATSMPKSVIAQLDDRESLVFKYHYQEHLPHEDIAEIISRRHRVPYTALEVVRAIAKINDLLSTRKRWLLLSALNANRSLLSIDELGEKGYEPAADDKTGTFDEEVQKKALVQRLNDALQELDPDDRLLLLLRYEHERTASQIASIMHYENHKYVYTRLRTVVSRLRRKLGLP